VFVAECGAHTSLAPLYGWSREGERAHFKVPRNRGANITLLASMSLRACLVKVRVNLFVGLGYAEGPNCDGFLLVETLRKPRKLPQKQLTLGSFSRGKEADLASSSLTLLLTKQALRGTGPCLAVEGYTTRRCSRLTWNAF
jgi:hypothetical protein